MIRFGLVGCGNIAWRHSHLLGTGQIEGGVLSAVCDVDFARASDLAKKFGVLAFDNFDDMMTSADLDVVVVLTPSGMHAEHVTRLAEYGKDIMVEKPMALTIDDADRMIAACDMFGCRLFVIKQCRFHSPVQALKGAITSGKLGRITLGTVRVRWARHASYYEDATWRGTWSMDGGVLTNQASHHLDLLEWLIGDVESVFARGTTALADIEAEDTAVVLLKFKSGALGVVEATTATRPVGLEGSISVLGTNGSVVVGGMAANELTTWSFEDHPIDDKTAFDEFGVNPQNLHGYGHKAYYDHVVSCIKSGGPNLVDGFQGRKSVELINAIYESVETGKEVSIRFTPKKCKLGQG